LERVLSIINTCEQKPGSDTHTTKIVTPRLLACSVEVYLLVSVVNLLVIVIERNHRSRSVIVGEWVGGPVVLLFYSTGSISIFEFCYNCR
jgi:hypothetical protein